MSLKLIVGRLKKDSWVKKRKKRETEKKTKLLVYFIHVCSIDSFYVELEAVKIYLLIILARNDSKSAMAYKAPLPYCVSLQT